MRRAVKKSLLEIFQTIYEAHGSIKDFIDKKEYEAAEALLSDCQEAAIQLGTAIENSEGEGFATIPFLEEYCEAVYEVAAGFPAPSMGSKVKKFLDKKLVKAENSVKNDIKARLEVVFMPYKASMWDSLESVWRAAGEDPDCDAYVVVLPYYDRNPDGSFGELHYEGSEFPDYVHVVHYEAYNLEKRHPDVVYIHNPYDEYNYVTSIDPRFYSYNLKKYTDCLVYIPYFVVSSSILESSLISSACAHSDKVIVQSEQIRDIYIETFQKSSNDDLGALEDRFISLGSPKFDAVVNAQQTEQQLPKEWREIIGSKKVVLYNTSTTALLDGNRKYLEKIVSVLNYFSEHREVVLWWRPHPLSEAVYHSMRSSLLDEYIKILQWYQDLKFGIFDDTPDLHRAIVCSDAYYGDRSSLVAMYQMTGKPVLLQNTTVNEYVKDNIRLGFEDLYDDGAYLWFSAINLNGLFKMDKKTMEPVFMGSFPNEDLLGIRLYAGIAECNGKLYFSPLSANEIAVYDMERGEFEKIAIDSSLSENSSGKLYSAVVYKNNVIFIPFAYNAIVCLNTNDGTLTYHSEWLAAIKNDSSNENNTYYFRKGEIIGSELYIPSIYMDKLLVFHLLTYNFELRDMKDASTSYHGIIRKNDTLIFAPYKGGIMTYDLNSRKPNKLNEFEIDLSVESTTYIDICGADDKIWLFPYSAKAVLELDTADNVVKMIDPSGLMADKKELLSGYTGKYIFAKRIGNVIYAYHLAYGYLLKYNIETSEQTAYNIQMKTDCFGEFELKKANLFAQADINALNPDDSNYLEGNLNLSDLCRYLRLSDGEHSYGDAAVKIRSELRKKSLSNADGTAGAKIYQYIKQMVQPIST